MAESVVLLWLEGPMQSWGLRARWDVRDSGLEPSKSGIVGLIGCAMGLERGDPALEQLDTDLRFGVRADRPGIISRDFHTVTGYHRTAQGEFRLSGNKKTKALGKALKSDPVTIISPHDYLHDAVFLVAVQTESGRAADIRRALASPRWPLFLGRKSCPPTRPLLDDDPATYSGMEEALSARARHPRALQAGLLAAYIEDPEGDLERQDAMRLNPLRMYDFRRCRYIEVDPPSHTPASAESA